MSQESFEGLRNEVTVSEDERQYVETVRAMIDAIEVNGARARDMRWALSDALRRYESDGDLNALRRALEYAPLGRWGLEYSNAVSNGKDTSGMTEQMKKRAEDPAYQALYDDFVALAGRFGLLELGERIDRAGDRK